MTGYASNIGMRHLSTATLLLVIAWAMPPAAGFTPQSEPAAVVVIEKAGDSMWTATWRLAEPARELRFEAPAAGLRARVFEVLTPGYRL